MNNKILLIVKGGTFYKHNLHKTFTYGVEKVAKEGTPKFFDLGFRCIAIHRYMKKHE